MEEILVNLCCPLRPRFALCPCRGGHAPSPGILTEASSLQRRSFRHSYSRNATSIHTPKAAARVSSPERPPKTVHGAATTKLHGQYPNRLPPQIQPVPAEDTPFRDRALFLSSIGVDLFELATSHPSILSSTSVSTIRRTVDLLHSAGLSSSDTRRVCGMCPEILCLEEPFTQVSAVLAFLIREAGVSPGQQLRHAIHRRPRLLVSDVGARLRPTLHFLRSIGVSDVARHAPLLSCGVEDKLVPRIDFLKGVGFAPRDARSMVARFPDLFCYSVEGNLEPKFDFYAMEMGRDLGELREFPEYFSYSLAKKIRPRHRMCVDNEVWLPLPALLRPSDQEFFARMKVCLDATTPLPTSPLFRRRRRRNIGRTIPSKNRVHPTTAAASTCSTVMDSIPVEELTNGIDEQQ